MDWEGQAFMPRSIRREIRPIAEPVPQPPDSEPVLRYSIDFNAMSAAGQDPSYMISARLCGRCGLCTTRASEPAWRRSRDELMKQIAASCSKESTYLLPSTPVTEAIFRLVLQHQNRPMSLSEIHGGLSQAWASVIYLKSLGDDVLKRMLEQRNEYSIRVMDQR